MRATVRARATAPLSTVLGGRAGLRALLPRLAADLSRGVRDRTAGGRDVSGHRFAAKADGSPSTLRDTGKMIASFGLRTIGAAGFVLAPADGQRAKAAAHMAGKRLPVRRWIGLSRRDIAQARAAVADAETERKS